MSARLDALAAKLAERELGALLVSNLVNVRWLTGFTGTNGAAVVGAGAPRFVTDFRYLTQAATQLDAVWEREIATDLLKRAVEGLPAQPLKLGFDDGHLTVRQHAQLAKLAADHRDVELVAAGGIVEALRAVKDDDEIELIRAAAKLADAVVLNAGAWSHYSRAIGDALQFAGVPAVEVHLSDVMAREPWRQVSVLGDACVATVCGRGVDGYREALVTLKQELSL